MKANKFSLRIVKFNSSVDGKLLRVRFTNHAKPYIMLLHKSFAIQMEKLEAAYMDGTITEEEYDRWFEFFESSKREWLEKDLTKPENIHFLAVIAKHNMETARKIKFT